VNWNVQQEAKQGLDLLRKWSPMDVDDALELLSPTFTDPSVRKYAVARLQQANDEVCWSYIVWGKLLKNLLSCRSYLRK
jgi:phosphatidylinositol 3-kinase